MLLDSTSPISPQDTPTGESLQREEILINASDLGIALLDSRLQSVNPRKVAERLSTYLHGKLVIKKKGITPSFLLSQLVNSIAQNAESRENQAHAANTHRFVANVLAGSFTLEDIGSVINQSLDQNRVSLWNPKLVLVRALAYQPDLDTKSLPFFGENFLSYYWFRSGIRDSSISQPALRELKNRITQALRRVNNESEFRELGKIMLASTSTDQEGEWDLVMESVFPAEDFTFLPAYIFALRAVAAEKGDKSRVGTQLEKYISRLQAESNDPAARITVLNMQRQFKELEQAIRDILLKETDVGLYNHVYALAVILEIREIPEKRLFAPHDQSQDRHVILDTPPAGDQSATSTASTRPDAVIAQSGQDNEVLPIGINLETQLANFPILLAELGNFTDAEACRQHVALIMDLFFLWVVNPDNLSFRDFFHLHNTQKFDEFIETYRQLFHHQNPMVKRMWQVMEEVIRTSV